MCVGAEQIEVTGGTLIGAAIERDMENERLAWVGVVVKVGVGGMESKSDRGIENVRSGCAEIASGAASALGTRNVRRGRGATGWP